MSKPPELTIYPLQEKVGRFAQRGYLVGKRVIEVWEIPYLSRDKRLTGPELAAEFWAAEATLAPGESRTVSILHRFATSPHYCKEAT